MTTTAKIGGQLWRRSLGLAILMLRPVDFAAKGSASLRDNRTKSKKAKVEPEKSFQRPQKTRRSQHPNFERG
ncbi:hypothetical protein WAI453_009849 [Rhynchosporium graminicola]